MLELNDYNDYCLGNKCQNGFFIFHVVGPWAWTHLEVRGVAVEISTVRPGTWPLDQQTGAEEGKADKARSQDTSGRDVRLLPHHDAKRRGHSPTGGDQLRMSLPQSFLNARTHRRMSLLNFL